MNIGTVRQTYIIMYEQDGIKYIFNRSVAWDSLISTKNLRPIINLIGADAIITFISNIDKMHNLISDATKTFSFDNKIFKILEIHSEWKNYNRCNQLEIEDRKTELCKIYGAEKRSNLILNSNFDINISKIIKKQISKWLIDIYNAIGDYAKLIKDETVKTSLGQTKEKLINEINSLDKEYNELLLKVRENKELLRRQNYIIDKYYKQYKFSPQDINYIKNK